MLNKPLQIDPNRFLEAYNYDVSDLIEKRPGAGNLVYLSYSHAVVLFRTMFPELDFDCEINPDTGSYIFPEIDGRGFFLKPYIHDGERRSPSIYYCVLSNSNQNLYAESGTEKGLTANAQLFNKAYYRAIVKAIAVHCGIGLKLWTGDDLTENVENEKIKLLNKIKNLADTLQSLTDKQVDVTVNSNSSKETILLEGKRLNKLIKDFQTNAEPESETRPINSSAGTDASTSSV